METLSRIKAEVDLIEEVKKTEALPNSHQIPCPFHEDENPSLSFFSDGYFCFGCGVSGSVIDWVMYKQKKTFPDAVSYLTSTYNINDTFLKNPQNYQQLKTDAQPLVDFVDASYKHLAASNIVGNPVNTYLSSIGIDSKMVNQYKIGLGVKPTQPQIDSGIVGGFENRLVYPVYQGNLPVNLVGRWVGVVPKGVSKSINMKGKPIIPFNEHRLFQPDVYVVEGAKDAILMESAGYPSSALIGTSFKKWKVGEQTTVHLCLDGDASEQMMKHGERLHRQGNRVYLVRLPSGTDPADLLTSDPDVLAKAIDSQQPFVECLVDSYDWEQLDSYTRDDAMRKVVTVIACNGHNEAGLAYLKKATKESLTSLKELAKQYSKDSVTSASPIWEDNDPKLFRPAQFFDDDTKQLHYTIHLKTSIGMVPFIVDGNKSCEPLTEEWIADRQLIQAGKEMPPFYGVSRWSIGKSASNGIFNFMQGQTNFTTADAYKLYMDIVELFCKYLIYPDSKYHLLISLWIMNTYIHVIHDTVPYLHLHGIKESGKTNTLILLNELCFNAFLTSVVTESVISREIQARQSTVIIDEAEHLREADEETKRILQALNQGYKKYAATAKSVKREGSTEWSPEQFMVYSPKAFASINAIHNTLSDRCITLNMQRVKTFPDGYEHLNSQKIRAVCTDIRNRLYLFGLTCGQTVYNTTVADIPSMRGRTYDLWFPIMKLATLFNVVPEMTDLMEERLAYKQSQEEDTNIEKDVFYAIVDCMKYHKRWDSADINSKDWYSTSEIMNFVKDEFGVSKFSSRYLAMVIFDLLHIANRKTDKKRVIIDGVRSRSIRLTQTTMSHRGEQMFGETIDWEDI